jgi:hypothetical protein
VGVVAMLVSVGVLVHQVLGANDRRPEAVLFAYDLSGLSVHEDEVLLGRKAFPAQDLDELRDTWDAHNVLSVLLPPEQGGVQATVGPGPADELARDWREEVPSHLGAYLSIRWDLFQTVIGVSDRPAVVVHPGIDGNGWGYAIENPEANRWFRSYLGVLATDSLIYGTAWARPIWYLAIAAGASAFLLRRHPRRRPGGLEVGFLALGALAYEATFFVAAVGEGYRYSYPSITLGLLSGMFVVLTVVRDRWERRAPAGVGSAAEGSPGTTDPIPSGTGDGEGNALSGTDADGRTIDVSTARSDATEAAP